MARRTASRLCRVGGQPLVRRHRWTKTPHMRAMDDPVSDVRSAQVGRGVSVTFVIPARNESPTIGAVVEACRELCRLDKRFAGVLVVSDGSTDETASLAAAAGADVLSLKPSESGSKGLAAIVASSHITTTSCFFVDGDLLGLTPEHLASIADPYLRGDVDMSVGLFDYGILAPIVERLPLTTGERIFPTAWLRSLDVATAAGYALETRLNELVGLQHGTTAAQTMTHVRQRTKRDKVGQVRGWLSTLRMAGIVCSAISSSNWRAYGRFLRGVRPVSSIV